MEDNNCYEFGAQPFDDLMVKHELNNHDLVAHADEQISHKMVQKGRKGRKLSRKVQFKILKVLNKITEKEYQLKELFNY